MVVKWVWLVPHPHLVAMAPRLRWVGPSFLFLPADGLSPLSSVLHVLRAWQQQVHDEDDDKHTNQEPHASR